MQDKLAASGFTSGLAYGGLTLPNTNYQMQPFDSRPVLWKNVSALMKLKYGKEHLSLLSREAKVGLATISRIKNQDTSVGIEVLDRVAGVFGVYPWQLLQEDLDVQNLHNRTEPSPLAADLATQLDALADPIARERAYALATQVLALAASAPEAAPSRVPLSTPRP